ncbi:hypothetical protein BCV69DRAFT_284948 [Microstroma glucosiphilum]|uniref:Uncharacterized protein n=1 Tax=Pseudomicrostroma glucosiphilum TaxID=1684307 RepID=A0A316U2M3_9BASI|nr:hypothetical protein BCV69DRAFT_284948 [Pseudomicrostroma glucosiphilum]PWN18643.1 hypothetical protein BCV69DRAFT_284948 [Pseudomicrostroma glucosiphilum]
MATNSPSLPAPPRQQPFQTDVRRTRGLQAGHLSSLHPSSSSSSSQRTTNASLTGPADAAELRLASERRLAEEEERINKRIDEYIRTLEVGMAELVGGMTLRDKGLSRLEQEAFMSDYRCDTIVKSVQGLSGLSRALQLSLLLSQAPQEGQTDASASGSGSSAMETERQRLQREIDEMQTQAGQLVGSLFGRSHDEEVDLEGPPPVSDDEEDVEQQQQVQQHEQQQQPDQQQQQQPPPGLVDELIGAAIEQDPRLAAAGGQGSILGLPPFQEDTADAATATAAGASAEAETVGPAAPSLLPPMHDQVSHSQELTEVSAAAPSADATPLPTEAAAAAEAPNDGQAAAQDGTEQVSNAATATATKADGEGDGDGDEDDDDDMEEVA